MQGETLNRLLAELSGWSAADGPAIAVHAPARSEIAGNHTDHEGGRVIAGALDRGITAVARANGTDVIRVHSDGFAPSEVALDSLGPHEDELVTTAALVRGMAAQMAATGRAPVGFDLQMTSDIPAGGGLSSSAACELALCRAMELLWPGRAIDAVEAAKMAQRVENEWFGKPCGLMDQLAESLGGLALMDFSDPAMPATEKLEFDLAAAGYALCLTDVGCDHSAFNDEYAAVPAEMRAVAQALGAVRLCEVDRAELLSQLDRLRAELGDRAVLRALHYYNEDALVAARWEALQCGDMPTFLQLAERSGASSGMFLQNVGCGTETQPCMVAIALSEMLLAGAGATRIHGGGFGGSIQAFVPTSMLDAYVAGMDGFFGTGACRSYRIDAKGARAQWM